MKNRIGKCRRNAIFFSSIYHLKKKIGNTMILPQPMYIKIKGLDLGTWVNKEQQDLVLESSYLKRY